MIIFVMTKAKKGEIPIFDPETDVSISKRQGGGTVEQMKLESLLLVLLLTPAQTLELYRVRHE